MASGFEDSVQFTVLSTLADAQANGQSSLRTLTLENLFPYQAAVYSHPDPAGDLFDSDGRDPVRPFWTETIRPLLFAAQDTLTSLTLHACNGRNSIPGAALQGLHFPSLTYLSLRHVTFRGRADVGAEVFILANSANLSSLILLNCRMDIHQYLTEWGIENDSHTWAEVYRSFNRDLVELRYIIIQEEVPPLPWDDVDLRYRFLLVDHDGMAEERHARFQDGDDEDARALKDLLEVVRLRRTARLSLLSKQS
ncbi:hypothetical protein BV25DRAFT_1913136 [Artomyces pyxidatus]|uniref:Uncharacterized protein n=1 Tax=Artomyces pyxidatus TaxID=48021 RepID=A0ACB8T9T6_9AGAM|nr:hypothetical protein BV25DRAFT_1913136 [Artomyces pyxidatus]